MTPDPIDIETAVSAKAAAVSERQGSGWDIRNAPRNYISLVLFQIGSALFSFAAVWIATHYLGSEGYGAVVAVLAASQVAQIFVNWTSSAVVRFGVDEFVDSAKIARAFWVRFAVLAINTAIIFSLSGLWFTPLAGWLKLSPDAFWLVVAHFAITAFWVHVQMGLQGAKLARMQGLLQMIERLLIFVGVITLLLTRNLDYFRITVCYIAAPAIVTILGIFILRRLIFGRFNFDGEFLRKTLVYSVPLLPFSLVGYLSGNYVDAVFIIKFLSTRDLGIYTVATQMNGLAVQFPTLAMALLVPYFVSLVKEGSNREINKYFESALPNLTLFFGLIATAASFVGYYLIPIIFGEEFRNAGLAFGILITSTVLVLPVLCGYAALVHARSVTYVAAITSVLAAATNISLNFLLIPRFGMAGCAWATVLSYAVSLVAFAILLRRITKIPISWVFLAILPNLCGTVALTLTDSVWVAIAVGLSLFILVVGLRWRSVGVGINIMKRLVRM